MKWKLLITGSLFVTFLVVVILGKFLDYDTDIKIMTAWGLLFFELTFFYFNSKYFEKKGYSLQKKFPNVLYFITILLVDYFSQKYFFKFSGQGYIFYDIAIFLVVAMLNIAIFFEHIGNVGQPDDHSSNL